MKRKNDIFDDFYANLPKGRCHPCKGRLCGCLERWLRWDEDEQT